MRRHPLGRGQSYSNIGKSTIQIGWKAFAPSMASAAVRVRRLATVCSVTLKGAVAVGVFLGKLSAEVARSGVDVDLALAQAAGKLGVAGLDGVRGSPATMMTKSASVAPASSRTLATASGKLFASRLKSSMYFAPFF